jgi:hypothetical protein
MPRQIRIPTKGMVMPVPAWEAPMEMNPLKARMIPEVYLPLQKVFLPYLEFRLHRFLNRCLPRFFVMAPFRWALFRPGMFICLRPPVRF